MKGKQWIGTQKHKQFYWARIEFEEWWMEREWEHPVSRFILKTSGFFMLIVLGAASLFFGIGSHKKAFPELHPEDKHRG
ncbi:TPA: hypothetical protein MXD20_004786 [Klebsiella pneumoniae]|nr:hypothetical protein [Klebsiella pneumoniae]HDK6251577.1 hypothetical protein [Klebsiella pneumoniae]